MMRITFDNKAELDEFTQNMTEIACPSRFGLKEDQCRCDWQADTDKERMAHCYDCWQDALAEVVEIKE